MKKILLYITLLFLSAEGNVMAQQQMYICRAGQADAYEVNYMTQIEMMPDSFRIRQQPAYALEDVDSIVSHHPALPCRELGWWGNMTDGQSQYKARLKADVKDIKPFDYDGNEYIDYDVLFIIEAQSGICQSVRCELHFDISDHPQELMILEYIRSYINRLSDSTKQDSPYIYVKETGTGPRRFETWITNGPVLPDGSDWIQDGTMFWSDCSNLLADRPIEDVQIIIEAWVHQQPKKIYNPDYHPS